MPSPFPGMDPYLEGDLWSSVHAALATEIAFQLAPRIRPRYLALVQKRFVLDYPDRETDVSVSTADAHTVYPDVGVIDMRASARGGGATLAAPFEIATVMAEEVPVYSVEIRDTASRRLVAAIEILSPVNKRGKGRRKYLARRRKLLTSPAHLLEIDLLRQGVRVPMVEPLPAAPFFVFLSRANRRPITEVWPIRLEEQLPTVPVPLLAGDKDVPLDLQLALTTVYDRLGYDIAIDYSQSPPVPLDESTRRWATELLARTRKSNQ